MKLEAQSVYYNFTKVLVKGRFGTICDDWWGRANAVVLCRMLGFGGVQVFKRRFGSGNGPIWMDDVKCTG